MYMRFILYIMYKFTTDLDILRTKYLSYKRMKYVSVAFELYMRSTYERYLRYKQAPLIYRIWQDILYLIPGLKILFYILLYIIEFRHYEKYIAYKKYLDTIKMLEQLREART